MDIKTKIGIIIIDNNENILLIKEKNKANNIPLWNVIKGTYGDNGDETVFDAALRECKEEVSLSVKLINSIGCYISNQNDKIRIQFNFLAEADGNPRLPSKKEQLSRNEDISEIKWFSKKEILKIKPEEFISNRIFFLILDWISDKKYPLEIFKQIKM